ncbi:reductase [Spiractinospora alimapuensis]|uniref:reductase n=1 Tax=Spiractinospora alimapuensis TaxID=2820884 RepID=UPI001F21F573|nr:reductase [Spiractinospora alimapuensis]QVQ50171.1 reductase [Spiractinospora alimapuensis]
MRLLVLGGSHHVGRTMVESALARGDQVTTLNRGLARAPTPGVEALVADRTDTSALRAALGGREWDVVVDTWPMAPRVVRDSARLLSGRVGHYVYVSARDVHRWPWPPAATENAPLVDADPASEDNYDYPASKRGGELAVLESFPTRSLLVRAGGVVGPYENVARVSWWLRRCQRGGRLLASGPPDRGVQFVDVRDLVAWTLSAAERGLHGPYTVTSPPDHMTVGELLDSVVQTTGGGAELVWASPEFLEASGLPLGLELSLRFPGVPHPTGVHDADVSAALATGLTCRPVRDTVLDTWDWLRREGDPPPFGGVRPPWTSLDHDEEQRVLRRLASEWDYGVNSAQVALPNTDGDDGDTVGPTT